MSTSRRIPSPCLSDPLPKYPHRHADDLIAALTQHHGCSRRRPLLQASLCPGRHHFWVSDCYHQ